MIELIPGRVPLEQNLRAFRAGNELLAEAYLGDCRRLVPPDEQAEQLAVVFSVLFEFANAFHASISGETPRVLRETLRAYLKAMAGPRTRPGPSSW
ncbi:hypothetical protein [Streptomyces sp.]|uniref:hypothetical protein n=1 Tax=Streptomyces sp. TaxID=1931 RepID=UPI0025E3B5FD|nr:hypothetical protein [Streptomyces sp.]